MIHLFYDASAASAGSGPTYIRNVAPHLAARDDVYATILVSTTLGAECSDTTNVRFIELSPMNAGTRFLKTQRLIPQLIRANSANVLISAGNFSLFKSPIPQILLCGNALYTCDRFFQDLLQRRHLTLWLDTKIKAFLARQSVCTADCTIAPSNAFANELTRWSGKRAHAVHHGFDPAVFFSDTAAVPDQLRSKLERKDDELRLLYVSHYNYYRNFETLFHAVRIVKDTLPNRSVKLFLTCSLRPHANPGSFRTAAAAALVGELGISENLVELGAVPYQLVHNVYRACDLYVSPSYVETFAHPLVEAMASGLPVLASDLEVHREIAGDAAVYFPCFSPETLADRIVYLARHHDLWEQQAARGPQRSADFSWKKHVDEIIAIAKQLNSFE